MSKYPTLLSVIISVACVGPPADADWSGSAWNAVTDVDVWGPAAVGGLFLIDDFDQRATDWAVKHQPRFGSTDSAKGFSDRTALGLGLLTGLSLFGVDHDAHPTALEANSWIAASALLLPGPLKNLTRRRRPEERDRDSLPSGHAVSNFAMASAFSHNLDAIPIFDEQDGLKLGIRAVAYTYASGGSWARVEAGRHHPADILLGAAVGNFLSRFVNNLYHGPGGGEVGVNALVQVSSDSHAVGASWHF